MCWWTRSLPTPAKTPYQQLMIKRDLAYQWWEEMNGFQDGPKMMVKNVLEKIMPIWQFANVNLCLEEKANVFLKKMDHEARMQPLFWRRTTVRDLAAASAIPNNKQVNTINEEDHWSVDHTMTGIMPASKVIRRYRWVILRRSGFVANNMEEELLVIRVVERPCNPSAIASILVAKRQDQQTHQCCGKKTL